jgi:hypothetical protein
MSRFMTKYCQDNHSETTDYMHQIQVNEVQNGSFTSSISKSRSKKNSILHIMENKIMCTKI